jgi:type VI secretion system secreted protein Hcp
MAYDAFLWFPGATPPVEGETTDSEMSANKAIEIAGFGFGASNNVNVSSQSGGMSAGKAEFGGVSISKNTDKATMMLFTSLTTGKHFPEAVLALRRSGVDGKSGSIYLQFNFKMVFISSMSWGGGSGQDVCSEQVTLEYGSIKIQYFAQGKDGKNTKAGEVMWSRVLNKASDAVE